jgi:hypothetical protein
MNRRQRVAFPAPVLPKIGGHRPTNEAKAVGLLDRKRHAEGLARSVLDQWTGPGGVVLAS